MKNDCKWGSPTGNPIASHVTDQLTKPPENVTRGDVSEALGILEKSEVVNRGGKYVMVKYDDANILKRAIAAPTDVNAELLEALQDLVNVTRVIGINVWNMAVVEKAKRAISRAEQKGGV